MEVTVTVPNPEVKPAEGAKPEAEKKPDPVVVPTPNPELEAANKRIAELNKESEKHRLEAKEHKAVAERNKKALAIATGTDTEADPVALEKQKADGRVREAYLKSAFVSVSAKEMHDANFAFGALKAELADVKVDLETGEADMEAIKAKVETFKTSRPFLFAPPAGSTVVPPAAPKSPPDGGGAPAGGDPYKNWQQLKATGQFQAANEFYAKNSAAILKGMK